MNGKYMPQCIYAITKNFTKVEVSSKFLGGKSYLINAVSSKNFAKKLWKMMRKVIFFSVIEFSAFNLDALHAIKLHKLKI